MAPHPLVNRTSPKGQPFVGTCAACGVTGLTFETMRSECENVRGMTQEQALIEAVIGPKDTRQQPRTIPNPSWCERCEGRGYLVVDAEWEPYAVQCPECADRRPA